MSKIRVIREQLQRAERAHRQKEQLWKERIGIEKEVIKTEANQIGSSLELNEESLALKTKKLEIDHLLDEIEEEDEDRIKRLRKDLISTILDAYPEESTKFELFKAERCNSEELLSKIQNVIDHSQRVANSLGLALATWERPVMVRVMRYVFGPSPTEEITENLEHAGERCQAALEVLPSYRDHDSEDIRSREICEQLEVFFRAFLSEREERWSFGSLKRVYHPALQALEHFIERIEAEQKLTEERLRDHEVAFEQWLENFG